MKRINNLFDKICSLENIMDAANKASDNKGNQYGVKLFMKNSFENCKKLSEMLKNGQYKTSTYKLFTIYEPKERLLYKLPFYPDRIVHHAIMNILEPIWHKIFIGNTYSCVKGRGIHGLVRKLTKDLRYNPDDTRYCLKLDIKKFYPSIDHEILKQIIRKKIKDKKLLLLLDEIIDSADGVPIGNYLSQYFANLYLTYFDHTMKEQKKVKYYYRYADDIVILSSDKKWLQDLLQFIKNYLKDNLKLTVKSNYQIFPVDKRGIDYVGYVFFHDHILLRKTIKQNILRAARNKKISSLKTYKGWLKYCNSKHLCQKIKDISGVDLDNWNGKKTTKSNMNGAIIKHIHKMSNYYNIDFVKNGKSYYIKTKQKWLK